MINLKNGYGIISDGKSYTLIQYAIQTSKNGNVTEIQKSISFHSTLESALQGYSNCRMADLVSDYDMDLKFVKEAIEIPANINNMIIVITNATNVIPFCLFIVSFPPFSFDIIYIYYIYKNKYNVNN